MKNAVAVAFILLCTRPLLAASAQGKLTVDGKTIDVRYAYAVSGPDSFEGTREAYLLLLSEKALPAGAIQSVESFDELGGKSVRSLLDSGVVLKISLDKNYHMTVRHPALKGREIQESGGDWGLTVTALGPDRVTGTFASSSGMLERSRGDGGVQEIGMDHKAQFTIRFDAPVERRFPLEQVFALAANARKLPAGGGEPGKAWIASACKPAPAMPTFKDPKEVEKFLTEQGMTEKDMREEMARQSKLKGHAVTRDEALKAMAEMMSAMADLGNAMALKDCKVLSGSADDKVAIIQVEATSAGARQRTDVTLAREGNAWTVKKTGAWRAP